MNKDSIFHENAKVDWMKIVNKHKKKQKGLPALSTLNTNAGNVEHNIEVFNNSVDTAAINSGCCESLTISESLHSTVLSDGSVNLYYPALPIEKIMRPIRPLGRYNSVIGTWEPDDGDARTVYVNWEYNVSERDILEFLDLDYDIVTKYELEELEEPELTQRLRELLPELIEKYEDDLLENFYEEAIEDAQENYDVQNESLKLDDDFDLSLRTLL